MLNWQGWRISEKIIMTGLRSLPVTVWFYPDHRAHAQQRNSQVADKCGGCSPKVSVVTLVFKGRLWKCESTNCDLKKSGECSGVGVKGGWAWGGSWDTLLALQFNHCIPREVLTVVLWKLLKLLSKVKWNCSLSRQHWENKGICSWLLINAERDQHKGFIKLYITRVI